MPASDCPDADDDVERLDDVDDVRPNSGVNERLRGNDRSSTRSSSSSSEYAEVDVESEYGFVLCLSC